MKKSISILLILAYLQGFSQKNHGINWIEGGGHSYKINFKNSAPHIYPFNLNFQY